MRGASRDSLAAGEAALAQVQAGSGDASASAVLAEELFSVASLLGREPGLRRALADPSGETASRRGLLDGLLGAQLGTGALEVLRALVAGRWASASDLVDSVDTLGVTAALRGAAADGALDEVEDELFRFSRLVEGEPVLRSTLTDPALPVERKRALLTGLLEGKARPVTVALVVHSVTVPRGRSIEQVLERLSRLAAAQRDRVLADVRVPMALDDDQRARLTASLSRAFSRTVQLQVTVDPTVLGGGVVRVGDEVIDASVAGRLAETRERLTGR